MAIDEATQGCDNLVRDGFHLDSRSCYRLGMGTGTADDGKIVLTKAKRRRIVAVDLFCGAGGLTYGLRSAGLKVAAGVDLDPRCKFPIEQNCRAKFVQKDVATVTAADLSKWFGKADVRVLAGCAPCQPFSTYSQSRKSPDLRWELLASFQRLALQTLPEIVTMENVAGLKKRQVWADFVLALEGAGYWVGWDEVACTDYGVPQKRKRLVLMASRLGPIALPTPTHRHAPLTVADAIGRLSAVVAGGHAGSDPLHVASSLSRTNMTRIKASKPGGTWRDWPVDLRADCHRRESGATYPAVYGRMEWRKPSPTITTQFYGFGSGRFGHPEQDRAITIREAAILQSFPPDYRFVKTNDEVSFRSLGILIGNAVPPKLAQAIGTTIREHVDAMMT